MKMFVVGTDGGDGGGGGGGGDGWHKTDPTLLPEDEKEGDEKENTEEEEEERECTGGWGTSATNRHEN
ncbi:unnamed protein product [Enterobius vermicularis]|uniref:Uncharacterized protein n=1 Tax=Enterobius vermicularis TaxID=51028 RepID=A0A0N4VNR7_ENTVE|nr:unnamed protein product [Enterobius vermicularis]